MKITNTINCALKATCIILCLAASSLTVLAEDAANLITNPNFESTDGKITGWGQREAETIESFINPADSEKCGKIKFTYFTADKTMSKSNIFQSITDLKPGNYILSFSLAGENLKGIFAVLRFQKTAGFMSTDVTGKFEKYIEQREMPGAGKWKRFVYNFKVTEDSNYGTLIIEPFGGADQTGYALISNVRLVKQDEK